MAYNNTNAQTLQVKEMDRDLWLPNERPLPCMKNRARKGLLNSCFASILINDPATKMV